MVSVIVPVYNAAKYVSKALESVFCQTFKDYEVIVVNDGSIDDSERVISLYQEKIRYFSQENKGPACARNLGIRNARGNYVAFLDADDEWMPEKLERQMDLFKRDKSVKLIYTGGIFINEDGEYIGTIKSYFGNSEQVLRQLFISNCVSPINSVIVEKSCFSAVGCFDENLKVAEDWDLMIRTCRKYNFACIALPLVAQRKVRGSQSDNAKRNISNELIFLRKLFSDKENSGFWDLRRKSFSYRYFCAAWAFLEAGKRKEALKYIFLSLITHPVGFLSKKTHVGLLLRILKVNSTS